MSVSEEYRQWAAEAVEEWDGHDTPELLSSIVIRTGEGDEMFRMAEDHYRRVQKLNCPACDGTGVDDYGEAIVDMTCGAVSSPPCSYCQGTGQNPDNPAPAPVSRHAALLSERDALRGQVAELLAACESMAWALRDCHEYGQRLLSDHVKALEAGDAAIARSRETPAS